MGSTVTLGSAILVAVVFIGVAYYESYKHRRKWERLNRRSRKSSLRERSLETGTRD